MTGTSPTTPPLHCVPLSPGRGWRRSTPHTPARRGRSASPPAAHRSAPRPRSRGARSARTRSRSSAPWRSRRPAPSPPSRPRSRGASPPCAARPSRAEWSGRAGRPGRRGWWLPGGGTERGWYGGGAYWGGVILRWGIMMWGDTEVGWYWGGVILRWGDTEVGSCLDGNSPNLADWTLCEAESDPRSVPFVFKYTPTAVKMEDMTTLQLKHIIDNLSTSNHTTDISNQFKTYF